MPGASRLWELPALRRPGAILLALCCHLAGEVGDMQRRSGVNIWAHDIRALVVALAFAFLLVLDILLDQICVGPAELVV